MKKNDFSKNSRSAKSILIYILIFFAIQSIPSIPILLPIKINSWEKVTTSKMISQYSYIDFEAETNTLWVINDGLELSKFNLSVPFLHTEVKLKSTMADNTCISNDSIVIIGDEITYFINKDSFDVKILDNFPNAPPDDCIVDAEKNIIIYSTDWYGIYKQQSLDFFDGFYWDEEKIEILEIFSLNNNNLYILSADHTLYSYSVNTNILSIIGKLDIGDGNIFRKGISSNNFLWISNYIDHFYGWTLPIEQDNHIPEIQLPTEHNHVLSAFIDQIGRTWIFQEENIIVFVDQDEQISIKLPFRTEYISAIFIDENSNDIFLGSKNGVFRSNLDVLFAANAPKD